MEFGQLTNTDAEAAILGSILLDSDCLDEILITVKTEDFYSHQNKIIFDAICKVKNRGSVIDAITVSNYLTMTSQLEVIGGHPKIISLMEKVVSTVHVPDYCAIIKDKSKLRQLLLALSEVQEKAKGGDFRSTKELIDLAESKLFQLTQTNESNHIKHIKDLMMDAINNIEERFKKGDALTGVPTGFPTLDKMTSGLQPGEVVILGARPSMGKTTLSLNIATAMAVQHKKAVAYFSLEMPNDTLMLKLLSIESRIPFDHLKTGKVPDTSWPRLITSAGHLSDARLYLDDTSRISPFDIRSKCRKLKSSGNLDCIMIDYMGLIKMTGSKFESREREIAEISASLKELAKELKVPIIVLSQLNRDVEKRQGDPRPKIADIRDSGSVEQDADVILLLYRTGYYDKGDEALKNEAEIIVDKNRNGPTGFIKLEFRPELGKFMEKDVVKVQF